MIDFTNAIEKFEKMLNERNRDFIETYNKLEKLINRRNV